MQTCTCAKANCGIMKAEWGKAPVCLRCPRRP